MLVPKPLDTIERARSLLDYELPQQIIKLPKKARNNSMMLELDDFDDEFVITSSNNDDDHLKLNEPMLRPEQDVADQLRSIENFNNGEHPQFNQ